MNHRWSLVTHAYYVKRTNQGEFNDNRSSSCSCPFSNSFPKMMSAILISKVAIAFPEPMFVTWHIISLWQQLVGSMCEKSVWHYSPVRGVDACVYL